MKLRNSISTMLVVITAANAMPAAAQKIKHQKRVQSYSSLENPGGLLALADPQAPAPWQEQDPANALYKSAREELNRNNFTKAASEFNQIITRYPRSAYAADAYYWQAFALYKINGDSELKTARALLQSQRAKFPRAATVANQDAATLLARINGQLAERGDSEAGRDVATDAEKAASQQCPDDDDDGVRAAAMQAFLNMNSEQALPMLKQILARRDACSAKLRERAVFMVSQKRGAEVEDILLSTARTDPNARVREQAVFWLSQVNTDRALGHLEDILKTTNDDQIADKAIFAISQHRSERASQMLRDYASNPNAEFRLRDKAIFWLGQRRGGENTTFLKELYAKERDDKLKDKIIFALSQQRGNEGWLMDLATRQSESVENRKKALFWAGQNRGTPITELTALYDRMNGHEMKDQLIFVYSQRREKEAVDKLMDIREERNRSRAAQESRVLAGPVEGPARSRIPDADHQPAVEAET